MRKISTQHARRFDRDAQEVYGIPSACLMEIAGAQTAAVILDGNKVEKVAVFCGKGNNGGDGFVAARYLVNADLEVKVYMLCDPEDLKEDPERNYQILKKIDIPLKVIRSLKDIDDQFVKESDCLVDAIFGIGLFREVRGLEKELINYINSVGRQIIAVDVPSGLDSDTGEIRGACIKAHATVTFVAAKEGFFVNQGPENCGKIIEKDIGIPIA